MSQSVLTKLANGVPNVLVSAELAPFLTAAGTLLESRGQYQTLMYVDERSMAYQPPPLALKEGPYEVASVDVTPHPAFPLSLALQSVVIAFLELTSQ